MTVVVITDSSSRLSDDARERWHIGQVPLHILCDGHNLRDGLDPIPADIHQRVNATTAGATPAELSAAYRQALTDSDGDGVVAIHISAALSGTVTAAEQAARQFSGAVRVVNSRSAAMGTGFVALAAAAAAAAGAGVDEVEQEAYSAVRRGRGYVVLHGLDNLRRSGRIGTAASWLSTALAIKPVLRIDRGGRLVLAQRVRTTTKALATLVDLAAEEAGAEVTAIAVHHVDNPDAAAHVAAALSDRLRSPDPPVITDMGPVLALHIGAGAIAVCLDCAESTAPVAR